MPTPGEADPARQYRLVFAHSRIDRRIVTWMKTEMEQVGATVFVAEHEVDSGLRFHDQIRDAIKLCDEIFFYLTPWAFRNDHVAAESGIAFAFEKLAVHLLHGVDPKDFATSNYARGDAPLDLAEFDDYLRQLERRVTARKEGRRGEAQL